MAKPLLYVPGNSLLYQDRLGIGSISVTGPVRYGNRPGGRINLVKNPRFGAGSTTGWLGVSTENVSVVQDPVMGSALEFTSSVNSGGYRMDQTGGAGLERIKANVAHTLSWDAKLIAGDPTWHLTVFEFNSAGTLLQTSTGLASYVLTATPNRYSYVYTPINAATAYISFRIARASPTSSTIRISNHVIEQGSVANPSFFDGGSHGAQWVNPWSGVPGTPHASASYSKAGHLIEGATTNLVLNPVAANSAANGWEIAGTGTIGLVHDNTRGGISGNSKRFDSDGTATLQGGQVAVYGLALTGSARVFSGRYLVWAPAGASIEAKMRIGYSDTSIADGSAINFVGTGAWQEIRDVQITADPAKTISTIRLWARRPAAAGSAWSMWMTDAQIEERPASSSVAHGSMGTGYSFAGVADNSSSIRAQALYRIPEAGHIDPQSGYAAAQFTSTQSTESSQFPTVLSAGQLIAAKDRMLIWWPLTTKFVRINFDSNAVQAGVYGVTPPTPNAEQLATSDWDTLVAGIQVDGNARSSVAKGAPVGDMETSLDIMLGSTGGSSTSLFGIIGQVMIFEDPITSTERAKLLATPQWSMSMFASLVSRARVSIGIGI